VVAALPLLVEPLWCRTATTAEQLAGALVARLVVAALARSAQTVLHH
jgi:hypothetical protein